MATLSQLTNLVYTRSRHNVNTPFSTLNRSLGPRGGRGDTEGSLLPTLYKERLLLKVAIGAPMKLFGFNRLGFMSRQRLASIAEISTVKRARFGDPL